MESRQLRFGPLTTTIRPAWVGRKRSRVVTVPVHKIEAVHGDETIVETVDHYTTYKDDSNVPDYMRADDVTVRTGSSTREYQIPHTSYKLVPNGYEDRTYYSHDIEFDNGQENEWDWELISSGDRVYSVSVELFGYWRWYRQHNATQSEWSAKAPLGWRLLGYHARKMIKSDIHSWRKHMRLIKSKGMCLPMDDLFCVDANVALANDGKVVLGYGGIETVRTQRKQCIVENGDLVLLVIPANGDGVCAMHNVRTGDTWRTSDFHSSNIPRIAGSVSMVAFLLLLARIGFVWIDNHHVSGHSKLLIAASGFIGFVTLTRWAGDWLEDKADYYAVKRRSLNNAIRQIRTMGWICIRNVAQSRHDP